MQLHKLFCIHQPLQSFCVNILHMKSMLALLSHECLTVESAGCEHVQVWELLLKTSSLEPFQTTASLSIEDHTQMFCAILHQRQLALVSGLLQLVRA